MCGICGFTGPGSRELLTRMNRTLTHRGPDEEGYFQDGRASLAMRRLSIVDLAGGSQPQHNEDQSLWVVFNGELYNFQELREGLQRAGHRFATKRSDTENLVHLYEEFGETWPEAARVNGMFGLALWDARAGKLLLYRDRIGKKPLYYAQVGGDLVFGSEIKAILAHPAVSSELDFASLHHYFSLKNTSAPATAFKAVRQLEPGQYLVWQNGQTRLAPYWRLDFAPAGPAPAPREAADRLAWLLDDAVRLRMQCDAPYGAYLSGGVDSSSVVALMRRHQQTPVKTFCLGYREQAQGQFWGKAQDIHYARLMSQRFGSEHHEHLIGQEEFAESLTQVQRAFDEPFSGTISTFFLSILIRRHVKVALSGDGADELFGSYLSHRLAWPIHHYLAMARDGGTLREEDFSSLRPFDTPEQFSFLKGIAHPDQAVWRMKLSVFNEEEKRRLLSQEFLEQAGEADTGEYYRGLCARGTARDPLNAVLEVDQRELLANQVLPFMDRLSMAHSVEVRSPFLYYRIIEYANRLPGSLKIHQGENKCVHKLAVTPLLPADLIKRPKEGFVQPIYSWMRQGLAPWVRRVLAPERLSAHGFFNPKVVGGILDEHLSGGVDHSAKVWNLVCFQIWFETVCNRGAQS